MHDEPIISTFLFTDIEGSTRLWEQEPERMQTALARHDALVRAAVESHHGVVVKMTGDGVHAAFDDPLDAVGAALGVQHALANPAETEGIALRVRCGVHMGVVRRRDNDFFGSPVNRTARIMSVAHGGQMLLSHAVVTVVGDRAPSGVTFRDLGTVRLRDLESPERLYQIVHPGLAQDFPALRSLESTPNNLPQQATTFIGREREIADVKTALATTRLVTLLGAGGIGKTRLSLQVAADVLLDYPDGVWFVELAPLADERLVPQAVASVLGVKEEAGRPVIDSLIKHVASRNLLLIFDNCEHLVHACASLAEQLMKSGANGRILASSREPLRVSGEMSYPVPALGVPASDDPVAVDTWPQYSAVRLFIDRATAALPSYRLTAHNAQAVAAICRHLDGIPLAIELAAARVRTLSIENIAARLSDRFQLLTAGNRTALPRQQTLRALIDWSYDLLSAKERILFHRLAVFAGGWTLEAAEAVGQGGEVSESEVLDLLADLVDKSLVMVEAEGGRYRFLETVREYAAERLTQSGENDDTRTRHLDFVLSFVEQVAPDLLGPDQAAGLAKLDHERENILAAHGWCCLRKEGFAERDYRLVHAVKHYWFMRGLLSLGYRVTLEAVAMPGSGPPGIARCRALWVAGQIESFMGRYAEAQHHLQESLNLARTLDDRRMVAAVLSTLALVALGQGDRTAAQRHCEEALELARASGNKRQIASASNALAHVHRLNGDLDAADPLYRQCVDAARELGDSEVAAVGLLNLVMVAMARGAPDRAAALLQEVLTIATETGSRITAKSALEVSAGLAAVRGDWVCAARLYGAAATQTGITGAQQDPADEAFLMPLIDRARAALGDRGFSDAEATGRALLVEQAVADARAWLQTT